MGDAVIKPSWTMRKALLAAIDREDGMLPVMDNSMNAAMRRKMVELGWIDGENRITTEGRGMVGGKGRWYALPGNGPWKIDDACLAEHHNTTYAMRGYVYENNKMHSGRIRCTCPRALALREIWNQQLRAAQRRYYHNQPAAMPSWWSGPWRILPECPATGHNTLTRALRGHILKRCICPRALALVALHLPAEAEKKRLRKNAQSKKAGKKEKQIHISAPTSGIGITLSPDFTRAPCGKERALFDQAMENNPKARREAKAVCGGCSFEQQCGSWVMQEEKDKPGSWGGIWGGLSPQDRRRRYEAAAGTGAVLADKHSVQRDEGSRSGDPRGGEPNGKAGTDQGARSGGGIPGKRAYPHRIAIRITR